jgi:hypothetical protein
MTTLLRWPTLTVGVVVGLIMAGAAMIAGGSLVHAGLAGGIPVVYAVAVSLLATRSDVASVLAGAPVDERLEHLNMEAASIAFGATAIVTLAAFVAAQVTGGDWLPWALLCVAMMLSYVTALLVLRARG